MANSDKNILITPSVGLSTNPTIKFNGANNTPTTLRVLDDGTVSFEGTAGQLFSISDGLTGSIFSVNDISGIPSIEVLDTGLVKLNQYGGSTVFGSSAAIQNASSVNAKVSISTTSATTPGLIIKGVSSQSANLQEWQNSSGTVLAYINSLGFASVPAGLYVTGGGGQATALLSVAGASNVSSIISRGVASQTANLQEWQNSAGTVLARIQSDGALVSDYITSGIYLTSLGKLRAGSASNYGGQLEVTTTAAGNIGAVIRGAASQTANLMEFQNSSGTTLGYINAEGSIYSANRIVSPGDFEGRGNSFFGSPSFTGATLNVNTRATNWIGLIIRGVASQTANLQEWQNNAGTLLASVSNTGTFTATYYASTNNTGSYLQLDGSSTYINQRITNLPNLIIKAMASQTADLQQWQDSNGNTYAKIGPYGQLAIGDTNPSIYSNARISLNTVSASAVGQVIRGVASQTADLQQWQNSAGTVLAQIDAAGNAVFNNASTTNNINAFYGKISANTQGSGFLGQISAIATSASTIGMVIRGAASQTANLQEWQDSAGTVLSSVSAAGLIRVNNTNTDAMITATGNSTYDAFRFRNAGGLFLWGGGANNNIFYANSGAIALTGGNWVSGRLAVDTGSTGTVGIIVRGQASQTASLQEWQDTSGTVLGSVVQTDSNNMVLRLPQIQGKSGGHPWISFGSSITNTANQATDKPLVVKGAASQTANLTEWQDSSGTILGGMQSNGQLFGTQIKTKNAYVFIGEQNSGGSTIYTRQTATPSAPGANAANLYFRDGTNAGTLKLVVRAGASGAETTILDNIPQS